MTRSSIAAIGQTFDRVGLAVGNTEATGLDVLPSGLPGGLIPYTSAIAGDSVLVVAAAPFNLMDAGAPPPAPVIVRMPLDP